MVTKSASTKRPHAASRSCLPAQAAHRPLQPGDSGLDGCQRRQPPRRPRAQRRDGRAQSQEGGEEAMKKRTHENDGHGSAVGASVAAGAITCTYEDGHEATATLKAMGIAAS